MLRSKTNNPMSSKQRNDSSVPPGQVNIIGQGTLIEGGLTAQGDIRIAGKVIGNIKVNGKTVVTPEGEVEGEIRATQADIAGRVTGEIHTEERLILKDSAKVEGSLYTKKLVIEDGARFTGNCDMSDTLPKKQAPPSNASTKKSREASQAETLELQ